MRVRGRSVDWNELPSGLSDYQKESQSFITVGKEYEVHALVVFRGFPLLQVVDDLGLPAWRTSWLFDLVETRIPADWICSVFSDEASVIVGPDFVARDGDSFGSMVELNGDQVERFWKRVDSQQLRDQDED